MLAQIGLKGHRLGLQLYPEKDHSGLIRAIKAMGAEVDTVLPYVYDAQAAEANIITAIEEMAQGPSMRSRCTSSGQVRRSDRYRAGAWGAPPNCTQAWSAQPIASVGPVVSDELQSHGLRTDIYPANDAFS